MNWRATHVLTGSRDLAIVPNSNIAKSKIVNISSPSRVHGVTITVQLDSKTPPSTGSEILEHAILNCRLIVARPSPIIVVKSITATCTEFGISFFVEELASSVKAQNQLFDLIFRHLAMSSANLAQQSEEISQQKTEAEKLLELVTIFATLTVDERKTIAAKLKQRFYDEGETLVEPGSVAHSLFIVGSGVLSLTQDGTEGEIEAMRLGPGDHYGEIGMLTGAPSIAKITALMPATIYELTKEDLSPILGARPLVAQELSRALARRQAAGRLTGSDELEKSVPGSRLTTWFSDRIQRLFDLANAA
jgi:hypothetical protein